MPPEETSNSPASEPPRPSQRISVDGFASRSMQRPFVARRPQVTGPPPQPNPQPTPPPPSAPQPAPQPPVMPIPQQPTQPVPTPPQPIQPIQFAPPQPPQSKAGKFSKFRTLRRVVKPVLILIAVLVLGGGVFTWVKVQAAKNDPDTAFKDALTASLQAKQLETDTTAGATTTQALLDFTDMTDPLVSTQAKFAMGNQHFEGTGYGSAQNTYFSYTKLPSSVSASVSSVTLNAWFQLRAKGVLPTGVTPVLANLSDPRFQIYGPVLFGNFPLQTRQQLVNYLIRNHIYAYTKAQVTHTTLGGTKVFAYPIKLNVGMLKVGIESAALISKFSPSDVQPALDSLTPLNEASGTLYIDAATHRIVEITLQKGGQTTKVDYSHYGDVTLPGEPQTKLIWPNFAPLEARIENPISK